jgi:hypothetical protein
MHLGHALIYEKASLAEIFFLIVYAIIWKSNSQKREELNTNYGRQSNLLSFNSNWRTHFFFLANVKEQERIDCFLLLCEHLFNSQFDSFKLAFKFT